MLRLWKLLTRTAVNVSYLGNLVVEEMYYPYSRLNLICNPVSQVAITIRLVHDTYGIGIGIDRWNRFLDRFHL